MKTPFKYKVINDQYIEITGYNGKVPKNLIIPETIDNKPVTHIGSGAFLDWGIRSLDLNQVICIKSYAFTGNWFKKVDLKNVKNLHTKVFDDDVELLGFEPFPGTNFFKSKEMDLGNMKFKHEINKKLAKEYYENVISKFSVKPFLYSLVEFMSDYNDDLNNEIRDILQDSVSFLNKIDSPESLQNYFLNIMEIIDDEDLDFELFLDVYHG